MRFSVAVAALSAAVSVWAQTDHAVTVGQNGTLTFTPNQITVANGDSVTFSFVSKNHSVTQSTFADPCQRQTTPALGVDSGFQPIPAAGLNGAAPPQWKITITNASAPLWFYCAQTNPAVHCQLGMVFAINPTPEKTFAAFQQNAMNSAGGAGGAAASSPAATGANPTAATGAATGVASQSAAATLPTSLGSVPTGSVPTPATGLPVTTANSAAVSGAPSPSPSNGAGKLTGGLTGLLSVAVVAMLL